MSARRLACTLAGIALAMALCPAPPVAADEGVVIYTPENAPATPKVEDLELRESVSQYGITWTFAEPARVGQFISGDWYVVGPVTVTAIDPKPLRGKEVLANERWTAVRRKDDDGETVTELMAVDPEEAEEVGPENRRLDEAERKALEANPNYLRNGSKLNPPPVMGKSCFDSRVRHGRFEPGMASELPIEMAPGDALLSSVSREEVVRSGHYTPISVYAVLTCLAEPVPADAFRPGYMDRDQVIYLARDLDRSRLPRLASPDDVPEMASLVDRFKRPWVVWNVFKADHARKHQWGGYGQRSCFYLSRAELYLCLDVPAERKEPVLQAIVGMGIDLWAHVKNGHPGFPAWGGWNSGYKMPIVIAGTLLGDKKMASPSVSYPKCSFQEDEQTAYGPCWTGAKVVFTGHSGIDAATGQFRDKTRGSHLWGPYEHLYPTLWHRDQRQSDGYRRCCTSRTWPGQALAARLMGLEEQWAHDAYFDYVDRWMFQEETSDMWDALNAGLERPVGEWARQGNVEDDFAAAMWRMYRKTLDAPTDGWTRQKPNPDGLVLPEVKLPEGVEAPWLEND